jgi:WD40 repeat protein
MTSVETDLDSAERNETHDAFISYARSEKEFAIQVKAALESRGLSVWLDLESIAISTKWLALIQRGIESSNAFLFLLSPNSLQSEVCRAEVEFARAANKRIVPVRICEIDRTQVPAAIGEVQWLEWPANSSVEERAEQLAAVIRTDHEYVRLHSLFLARARAWKAAGSKRGYLLHGELLSRALEWLEGSSSRSPPPADEHLTFIERSRKHRSLVQRATVVSAIIGVIALATVLYLARQGQQEARLSASRRVAVSALNQIDSMHDEALLFSVAAYRIADTADARSALFATLSYQPDLITFLHGHRGPISAVAANSDESRIATASDDNHTILWSTATWQPIAPPLDGHSNFVWSAAFHPGDSVLATGSVDGTIRFWDSGTGKPLFAPLKAHDGHGYVTSLAFSKDGRELLSASVDQTLRRWSYPARTLIGNPLHEHTGNVWRALFLPDDARYVSCGSDRTVRIWDRASGVNTRTLNTGSETQCSLAVSEAGLVAVSAGDRVYLLDPDTSSRGLRAIGDFKPGLFYSAVAFMRGGALLITARADEIDFWDVASGARAYPTHRAETNAVKSLLYLKSKDQLVSGGWTRPQAKVWNLGARPLLVSAMSAHGKQGTMAIAAHPSRSEFVTGGWDRKLLRWTLDKGELKSRLLAQDAAEGTLSIRFNRDGTRIVTADAAGNITVWDANADNAKPHVLGNHKGAANIVATPALGGFIASGGEDAVIAFWNWDGTVQGMSPLREHRVAVVALALSSDGSRMASGDRAGRLLLWTLGGKSPHFIDLTPHANGVRSVMFTPTGDGLVTAGNDGKTKLWDLDQSPPAATELDSGSGLSVATAFTADGRTLALVSDDNVTLIDLAGRAQRIGVIRSPHASTVAALTFSADGKFLATSSWLGSQNFKIWGVNPEVWADQACFRANRALTSDETSLVGVDAATICRQK